MNFYNNIHPYYCGIDLHAKSLYVCIIDQAGETCLHKEISASPDKLYHLLEPYIGNIVVGVECMHCWYWVADFCDGINVDFILGHALYMKAIQKNIDLDMTILDCYAEQLSKLEWYIQQQAKQHISPTIFIC